MSAAARLAFYALKEALDDGHTAFAELMTRIIQERVPEFNGHLVGITDNWLWRRGAR